MRLPSRSLSRISLAGNQLYRTKSSLTLVKSSALPPRRGRAPAQGAWCSPWRRVLRRRWQVHGGSRLASHWWKNARRFQPQCHQVISLEELGSRISGCGWRSYPQYPMESAKRLGSEVETKAWLDGVVALYAQRSGISLSSASHCGPRGGGGGAVMNSEEFLKYAVFAGHSLGERPALASVAGVLPISSLIDVCTISVSYHYTQYNTRQIFSRQCQKPPNQMTPSGCLT